AAEVAGRERDARAVRERRERPLAADAQAVDARGLLVAAQLAREDDARGLAGALELARADLGPLARAREVAVEHEELRARGLVLRPRARRELQSRAHVLLDLRRDRRRGRERDELGRRAEPGEILRDPARALLRAGRDAHA